MLRLLPDAEPRPYPTFDEVFDAVTNGSVSLGVVPIENSIGGSIHRNYDLLVEARTVDRRRGAGAGGAQPAGAAGRARSARCGGCCRIRRRWRSARGFLRGLERRRGDRHLRHGGQRQDGARRAAARHGGDRLRSAPARCSASTRCAPASRTSTTTSRGSSRSAGSACRSAPPDKTSLVFTLQERAGGAVQGAERLRAARHRSARSSSRGRSRAARGNTCSMLDVAAAREDLPCARAMVHLAEFAASLRTLGSYPRWREPEVAAERRGGIGAAADEGRSTAVADGERRAAEVAERRHHRWPEPRAGARDAASPSGFTARGSEAAASSASRTPGSRSARAISICAISRSSVKAGIRAAGGTPMEFNTVSISDGITMGSAGMRAVARQPRSDRRLDRAGHARQSVRRARRSSSAATRPSRAPRWRSRGSTSRA